MKYPKVRHVKPVEDFNVLVTFENDEVRVFDVKPYIRGEWFGQLRNLDEFNTVRPCGNTIEWSGGQDIAPHELYERSNLI